jgi:hypothetical protein
MENIQARSRGFEASGLEVCWKKLANLITAGSRKPFKFGIPKGG